MLGKRRENGSSRFTPRGTGGHEHFERESPVRTHPGVSRFQQAFPARDGCLQGRAGSGAFPEAE